MPERKIAKVRPLTPREKEVYSYLCRKIRFPLLMNHARACYMAIDDALEELHGSDDEPFHPALLIDVSDEFSLRATKVLRSLGIHSIKHLMDYEVHELVEDCQACRLYDHFVGLEIGKVRRKYKKLMAK